MNRRIRTVILVREEWSIGGVPTSVEEKKKRTEIESQRWYFHFQALILLKRACRVACCYHGSWCWSLNKISSPALWIRAVKRFQLWHIIFPTWVKKKRWRGSHDFETVICLLQPYNARHTVPHISRSAVTNESHCRRKEWHTGLTYFSQGFDND